MQHVILEARGEHASRCHLTSDLATSFLDVVLKALHAISVEFIVNALFS